MLNLLPIHKEKIDKFLRPFYISNVEYLLFNLSIVVK
jgi:hypothetical protein